MMIKNVESIQVPVFDVRVIDEVRFTQSKRASKNKTTPTLTLPLPLPLQNKRIIKDWVHLLFTYFYPKIQCSVEWQTHLQMMKTSTPFAFACDAQSQNNAKNDVENTEKIEKTITLHEIACSLMFVDAPTMQHYNHQYRHKNYVTNVLTFNSHSVVPDCAMPKTDLQTNLQNIHLLQSIDMVLCPEYVMQEAQSMKISMLDHCVHLYMHGLLHGLGFDHECTEDAQRMEALESQAMQSFGFINPYCAADVE